MDAGSQGCRKRGRTEKAPFAGLLGTSFNLISFVNSSDDFFSGKGFITVIVRIILHRYIGAHRG